MNTSKTTENAVREVVREPISNAIFHGGASIIGIHLENVRENVIHLTVEEQGVGPLLETNGELGSRLMDLVALGSEHCRDSSQTRLEADFATPSGRAEAPTLEK